MLRVQATIETGAYISSQNAAGYIYKEDCLPVLDLRIITVTLFWLGGGEFTFIFILSYFNTKTLSPKKENRKTIAIQINIYLHIKSYDFAGLPRDCASGRMLVFQKFLQFPFENGDRGAHSDI